MLKINSIAWLQFGLSKCLVAADVGQVITRKSVMDVNLKPDLVPAHTCCCFSCL